MPMMKKPIDLLTGKPKDIPSPFDVVGPMGMVGGLPEGLNSQAIEELLKRLPPEAPKMMDEMAVRLRRAAGSAGPDMQMLKEGAASAYDKYIRKFFGGK